MLTKVMDRVCRHERCSGVSGDNSKSLLLYKYRYSLIPTLPT